MEEAEKYVLDFESCALSEESYGSLEGLQYHGGGDVFPPPLRSHDAGNGCLACLDL